MPAKKKTTKKAAPKKKTLKYNLTLNVHGEDQKFSGDTMGECLSQFEVPDFIKSMVYITGNTKEHSTQMVYNGREAQRLFANHGAVDVLAARLEKRLT